MKAKFELKNYMTANRELVISKYNDLSKEDHFNGISLKSFMMKIWNTMVMNNPRSEKTAAKTLSFALDNVYYDNCQIEVINDRDAKLAEKYKGTAYMALV
jgi:hypothetical protein